eukprot:18695-Heterococcus_DN1.PRE.4
MPNVQVIWTLNKSGTTGLEGGLALVASRAMHPRAGEESVIQKPASMQQLKQWCDQQGFVEHSCELVKDLGLNLTCYAQPHSWAKEHKGNNNILATFFTCRSRSGLAPNTVIGKAVFVKRDAAGEPVDLSKEEFIKMAYFLGEQHYSIICMRCRDQ